ncbi:hypothetical protein F0562_002047 [Nyssa sinensis]|uniref:AT-hook motif nuclear-localized protein n=1 Tax=Nyssa sinensis TaxID=561372 RepID=A0A5J5C4P3_9ASTE|nr:hypothetical protein F0562_002047 [Nyssa sinensis]
MEAREGMISGVNVIGAEKPSNSTQVTAAPPVDAAPPVVASLESLGNKKRGRPRKYGPDGANTRAFSPMPISSRVSPATANLSAEENNQHQKVGLGNLGVYAGFPLGDNFTRHTIPINVGEDVAMKILTFSQLQPWGICIMAAVGSISKVTLREPDSSRATLTYEVRHFILLS